MRKLIDWWRHGTINTHQPQSFGSELARFMLFPGWIMLLVLLLPWVCNH